MSNQTRDTFFKKDFWTTENLKYAEPHFRLEKCARVVNGVAGGRECDLLDLGCGPGALARLLSRNIRYQGIDIAVHDPAPHLREADFVEHEIPYAPGSFDIIVASGVFEYVGSAQNAKFEEIRTILRTNGTFIVSYMNFEHVHRVVTPLYNNVRLLREFKSDLRRFFRINRCFPVSYNWRGTPPRRPLLKRLEMHFNLDLPLAGRKLAVEYFFVCSPRQTGPASGRG